MTRQIAFTCMLVLSLVAPSLLSQAPAAQPVTPEEVETAGAAVAGFRQALMAELMKALPDGLDAAIRVCRERAPELAREHSRDGVNLGRTSHRLRNPANRPEAWLEPFLKSYREGSLDASQTALFDDGTFGYVEPIRIGKPCLRCHGTEIEDGVQETLRQLYPDDEAVGFKEGDFRGVFWARMSRQGGGAGD